MGGGGAITSESTPENPCVKHHYLFWEGAQFTDFVLRFRHRLVGGNSGVQIRSKKPPEYDAWGYQADMEAGGQDGCLFQHDREAVVKRGFAVIAADGSRVDTPFADPEKLHAVVKQDDWNDYEVSAIGPKITLRISRRAGCARWRIATRKRRGEGYIGGADAPGAADEGCSSRICDQDSGIVDGVDRVDGGQSGQSGFASANGPGGIPGPPLDCPVFI